MQQYIVEASKNINKLADDLQLEVLQYKGYGKDFLKKQKLSPDSFVQMALQYAFYKYVSIHLKQLKITKNLFTQTTSVCRSSV